MGWLQIKILITLNKKIIILSHLIEKILLINNFTSFLTQGLRNYINLTYKWIAFIKDRSLIEVSN